ncbi:spermidine synthase [Gilvimarinus polysaccharolyticus]|uniref:spermidine synthase n=1 Tax=Gilvimarinus polysaccharolyticus TaxID=863921 RepID=UPI0006733CC9|nr:spermidine synthase [Gilvimarinus polysaccharolyticus]
MARLFAELDSQPTSLGEISLRRRIIPTLGDDYIYEVKLGEEFLMSSLFVDAEVALADLGLAATPGEQLKVVVGGLGLGYTAKAALNDQRINELLVVEFLQPVINWHKNELVPVGEVLNRDPRCRYVLGSFFDLAQPNIGFDPNAPGALFDAILLDIDHSPSEFLNSSNAGFYTHGNLSAMAQQLKPGGVFAMWSQNSPNAEFIKLLESVFAKVTSELVTFYNPFAQVEASNSVYVAHTEKN